MASALLPALKISFSPSLHDYRHSRLNRRTKTCASQETTVRELNVNLQEQDRVTRSNKTIFKPSDLVPGSQTPAQDTTTPLVSALQTCAKQDAACFHFPGHSRGRAAPSSLARLIGTKPFLHDLPELPELDNLFSPKSSILEAQKLAAKLFGSSETWFLVGGTTCGIQASIMATCSPGSYLILPRNSHISAISGMVLSGAIPKYIMPEYNSDWDIPSGIMASQVAKAMKELEIEGHKAEAVLVTSPTYHGICSDLSEISRICHSHRIPLIVDEAHGAHFGFHPNLPNSASQQGSDLTVQSTHKVLCSLTQSSMLHMNGDIVDRERISRCLQVLQSTSPNYLLLASLDAARAQISKDPEAIFNRSVELAIQTANSIKKILGISLFEFPIFSNFTTIDPLRLTIGVSKLGISGYEADNILCDKYGIIPELVGTRSLTFAINLGTCKEHVNRLLLGLDHLSSTFYQPSKGEDRLENGDIVAPFADVNIRLSPREAFFASKRRVSTSECIGEVCGELICPYPPGIPVVFPGEIITERALNYLLEVKNKGAEISGASDSTLSSIVVCRV